MIREIDQDIPLSEKEAEPVVDQVGEAAIKKKLTFPDFLETTSPQAESKPVFLKGQATLQKEEEKPVLTRVEEVPTSKGSK